GYLIIGAFGSILMLIALSFDAFWDYIAEENFNFTTIFYTPEVLTTLGLTLIASILLYHHVTSQSWTQIKPLAPAFLIAAILFFGGFPQLFSTIVINVIMLLIGVLTIRDGALNNHLGVMNYGLLIITALVISRFF